MSEMTAAETELSKKLLNAQMMAAQAVDLGAQLSQEIDRLKRRLTRLELRLEKTEAVVEGMAIGKSPGA